ncbi:unnamed protein product [Pleuronectes platessa]|uniref:Uncharacterized protein n=1 Tax=Pleuronectes platessa TaxID=8262 RepID=A0A9N7VRL8_PLEPL|nr:unnamed protein product [Pleuronectes platessa]
MGCLSRTSCHVRQKLQLNVVTVSIRPYLALPACPEYGSRVHRLTSLRNEMVFSRCPDALWASCNRRFSEILCRVDLVSAPAPVLLPCLISLNNKEHRERG